MNRIALAGLLAGALLLAAPAAASAASCSLINENQSKRLVGTLIEDRYTETYSGGGKPRTDNHKITRFSTGTLSIRATTCRSDGRWRVLNPVVLTPRYANVRDDGTVPFGATGWGLAPVRVEGRKLVIRAVWCRTSRVRSGVKGVLGIPIPGPFEAALAQYIAQQGGIRFLPRDKTRCRGILKTTVPLRFGKGGRLKLGSVSGQRTYLVDDRGDFVVKKDRRVTAEQG